MSQTHTHLPQTVYTARTHSPKTKGKELSNRFSNDIKKTWYMLGIYWSVCGIDISVSPLEGQCQEMFADFSNYYILLYFFVYCHANYSALQMKGWLRIQ